MSVFGAYARYYDLLNAGKNYRAEADYVDRLLREAGVPARTILELGCGTGLHASALVDAGYDVTGVDRSETMLAAAE
ncbi:MAG TPA: methyltransferase domain-containing protein, partial [Thermoanaerobaculia bacterium]|nr:methyltransferase domain-containing protein [Thermoanaerobaculia bacterium]